MSNDEISSKPEFLSVSGEGQEHGLVLVVGKMESCKFPQLPAKSRNLLQVGLAELQFVGARAPPGNGYDASSYSLYIHKNGYLGLDGPYFFKISVFTLYCATSSVSCPTK